MWIERTSPSSPVSNLRRRGVRGRIASGRSRCNSLRNAASRVRNSGNTRRTSFSATTRTRSGAIVGQVCTSRFMASSTVGTRLSTTQGAAESSGAVGSGTRRTS